MITNINKSFTTSPPYSLDINYDTTIISTIIEGFAHRTAKDTFAETSATVSIQKINNTTLHLTSTAEFNNIDELVFEYTKTT